MDAGIRELDHLAMAMTDSDRSTDQERSDSTIASRQIQESGEARFSLFRFSIIAVVVVLVAGGAVAAIDRWIIPSSPEWLSSWQSQDRRDDSWADWYANRPPRTVKPIPHFTGYEPGPWALEFNGEDSFVYFADPGPIPVAVTLEVITTLRLAQSGTLLRWFHGDETVAIGLNLNGELGLGRVGQQPDGATRWHRPLVGTALARPLLDEPIHIVAQWDGDNYQMFINGQSQLTRTEYGSLLHGKSDGIFVGGVPPMELNEPAHISPFATALIHEVRITRGLRYHDNFSPPTGLTRDVNDPQQHVLLLGSFREKTEHDTLADPLILSRTIRNANWVRQP